MQRQLAIKSFARFAPLAAVLLFLTALGAGAQTAAPAEPWQRAIGPWPWQFPRDHGEHTNFKTEWWYFTGNLHDANQRRFGYQLTIFRQAVQYKPSQPTSQWGVRDFFFGHFTISDLAENQFHVAERVSRGALGDAKSSPDRMDVSLGPWTIQQDAKEQMHLTARDNGMAIDFMARPLKPLVFEGVHGLSQKSDGVGEASYYYSYPLLATSGKLSVDGKTYDISGPSWFDQEFSSDSLGKDQIGWDWFCIQLDGNEEIMLYAIRNKTGEMYPNSEGTWMKADGTSERLVPGSFSITRQGTSHRGDLSGRLAYPHPRSSGGSHRFARHGRPGIAPVEDGVARLLGRRLHRRRPRPRRARQGSRLHRVDRVRPCPADGEQRVSEKEAADF